jgi:hypothetical protein
MNAINYLKPMWVADCIRPQMSECTNTRGTFIIVAPSRRNDSLYCFLALHDWEKWEELISTKSNRIAMFLWTIVYKCLWFICPNLSCHKFALELELVALLKTLFVSFDIPNLYKSFSNLQVATNWLNLERM